MKKKHVIGNYIRKGIRPKVKPRFMHHEDEEYLMELIGGFYETQRPKETVGKIGVSYPPKKKFTYKELINLGYKAGCPY